MDSKLQPIFIHFQIKPDPIAKKEYFSKAFCDNDTPPPKSAPPGDDSDSNSSDDEGQ